jgi:hypothetical protein
MTRDFVYFPICNDMVKIIEIFYISIPHDNYRKIQIKLANVAP